MNAKRSLPLWKRWFDVSSATVLLILLAPALLLAAILIKATSRGPILFVQKRLGWHGHTFSMLKLRTMVDEAWKVGGGLSVATGDPRITAVGRILRQLHIDEIPQLINVLRGEMSLIGPRAALPFHYDYYEPWEMRRLDVSPGITGWAQVKGGNSLDWNERIKLDVWYVENLSFSLDLRIAVLTLRLLARRLLYLEAADRAPEVRLWTRGMPLDPFTNQLERGRKR
jgi:lipopolysaccharide/colanic/teichoic acid biosynthesis glycosyltransferase